MKIFILSCFMFHVSCFMFHLNAQVTFRKIFIGDLASGANAVLQTDANEYFITGSISQSSTYYFYLIRIDQYGDTIMTKRYGGGGDIAYDIIETPNDKGYLLVGTTGSFGAGGGDWYLIKTNTNGDTLWTKTYGGSTDEWVWSIQKTIEGGFILSGQTTSYGAGLNDIYVIKVNSTGDTLWTRTFGDSEGNASRCIYPIPAGGFLVMGGGILRIDNNGQIVWLKGLYGGGVQYILPARAGYYLSGGGGPSFNGYYSVSVVLFQIDTTVNVQWAKSYNIQDCSMNITAMDTTMDNGYIIAGEFCATGILGEAFLMRIDSAGNLLWARAYKEWEQIIPSEITKTVFNDVKSTSDGGFIAVGMARSFFKGDVYMVKTDANGNSGCNNDSVFYPSVNFINITVSDSSTQVGSGGIVGSYTTTVSGTNTTDSTLCFDTITAIKEIEKSEREKVRIEVYPNPFAGAAMLAFNLPEGIPGAQLIVTDISGRTVATYSLKPLNKEIEITSAGLEDGIYVARIIAEKITLAATKLIVLK